MYFWTIITVLIYLVMIYLNKQIKLPMFNSVLYSTVVLVLILLLTRVDYASYRTSASLIANSLNPLVILLAIPLYKYKDGLKNHVISIALGIIVSGTVSTVTIVVMSTVLGISKGLTLSLIPKSITTPMALSMTEMLGGIQGITVVAVVLTGITGATIMPLIIKIFNLKNPVAIGVALGSTAHGIGTSKAIEIGEEAGAISGLAMGLTGVTFVLITSLTSMFL